MRYSLFSVKNRQRTLFFLLLFLFCFSLFGLFRNFYTTSAQVEPISGGQITEGMVGVLHDAYNFNPLFAAGIETDVTNLLFLGLMRYNPETGDIEDYMATHDITPDKKTYTFTLKENLVWHDGQPITANDILFTYRDVIQHEDFPGALLKSTFQDVKIEKKDERTVSFTIPEKRKTFFTNFTLGILPRHQLINIPVESLIHAPFNQNPVGSGPYRFEEVFQEANRTSVRFSAFPDYFLGEPKVESITFYVYPTIDQLLPHVSDFDAIRPLQTRVANILPNTSRFTEVKTVTPRYLAVFFNLKDEEFTTKKIRQAMRAAVDTSAIAADFYGERVDTPLVELWPQNDIVNTSVQRAQELLVESGYLFDYERNVSEEGDEESEDDETLSDEEESKENEESTEENESEEIPAEEEVIEEEVIPAETEEEPVEEVVEEPQESVVVEEEVPAEEETEAPETTPQEEIDDAEVGAQSSRYIYEPTREKQSTTTKTDFYIVGSFPTGTTGVSVNGYRLQLFTADNERFSYHASTTLKTLTYGENTYIIRFYDANNTLLDEEIITITLSSGVSASESGRKHGFASTHFFFPSAFAEESKESSEEKKYRTNEEGEHISLSLSYLETFEYLGDLAERLQKEWEAVGIEITLNPLSPEGMRNAMTTRDYELLLLPQYLGYNLDPYPYFHLSQAKEGGFNVANWKNLKASLLLEEIRSTHDPEERLDSLSQLRDIIIDDVPAIFLFTPHYSWLYDAKVKNVHVEHMEDAPDRYARVHEFYIRQARQYSQGGVLRGFFSWLRDSTRETFSF